MYKRNLGQEITNLIENDVLPDMLNFSLVPLDNIDWSKITYDEKTPEYYYKKFPNGWQCIQGFEKVFEEMAYSATSPLDEINNRMIQSQNILIDRKLEEDKVNSEWIPLERFNHIFEKIKI